MRRWPTDPGQNLVWRQGPIRGRVLAVGDGSGRQEGNELSRTLSLTRGPTLEGEVNLENVSRDDWIVGGLALLLVIALVVFPWFAISVTVGAFSASASYSATGAPDGWLGVLALLAALALIADLGVERFSPRTQIPAIGGSRTSTRFILAAAAAAFVVLKFLFHIHFSLFGWGFYVTVIITAALVYYAMQVNHGVPAMPRRPSGPAGPAGPAGPTSPSTPAGSGGSMGSGGSTPPRRV